MHILAYDGGLYKALYVCVVVTMCCEVMDLDCNNRLYFTTHLENAFTVQYRDHNIIILCVLRSKSGLRFLVTSVQLLLDVMNAWCLLSFDQPCRM